MVVFDAVLNYKSNIPIIPDFQEIEKKYRISNYLMVVFDGVLNYNNNFVYYCFIDTNNTEILRFLSSRVFPE